MSIYIVQQSQNLSWSWCELFDDGSVLVVTARSPQEYPSEEECLLSLSVVAPNARFVKLPYIY